MYSVSMLNLIHIFHFLLLKKIKQNSKIIKSQFKSTYHSFIDPI